MKDILLDTNIIIYSLNGDPATIEFLRKYSDSVFSMSMVSWIETLAGSFYHGKTISEIADNLDYISRLPISDSVGRISASILQNGSRKGRRYRFQDSVIAATAVFYNMPLFTNTPKDFRGMKGLKVIAV